MAQEIFIAREASVNPINSVGNNTNRRGDEYEPWGNSERQTKHIGYGLFERAQKVFKKMKADELEEYEDYVGEDYDRWYGEETKEAYLLYLKKHGYTDEDMDAVRNIYEYTTVDGGDSGVFRSASTSVKNGTWDKFDIEHGYDKVYTKIINNVESFIKKSPKFFKTTYRGMGLYAEDLAKIKVGATFDMDGISSWSSNKGTASIHAQLKGSGMEKVLFVSPKQPRGTSINHISANGDEDEVMVSHTARYTVGKIEKKDGFTYIHLKPR